MVIAGGGLMAYMTGYVNNPTVGVSLNKFGKTSLKASCTVTAVSQTVNIGGVTVKGMAEAQITNGSSAGGDSGGPYWKNSNYYGIHSASTTNSNTGIQYVYFTPNYYLVSEGFYIATN